MADDDEPRWSSAPSMWPRRAVAAVLAVLTLTLALSFAGGWWWRLDLLAHFHAIYLLLATVMVVTVAALRWWRLARWAAVLVVVEAALVLPLYRLAAGTDAHEPAAPRLRVVSYNMLHGNPQTPAAARHIATLAPDVVVLLEVSSAQLPIFAAALPGWHALAEPRNDAFGIAVLTREPPTHAQLLAPGPAWMPALALELELAGHSIALMAVHPPPPVSEANTRTRDELLHYVSRWAAAHDGPTLVVGDLNATPWSSTMREILDDGPLRTTQRFGLQGTWPAKLGMLALPIDHVLYSGSLHPVARTIEPAFGSDHRMLYVELELR